MAMLLNVFAPSIAHAIGSMRGDFLPFDICSVNSVKSPGKVGNPGQSPADDAGHKMQHCVFCSTHAGSLAPPPTTSNGIAVIGGHDRFPALYYQSPAPLFSWSAAKPRGPPPRA